MMGGTYGKLYRFTVFGESHAPEIGVVIEGLPAGFLPDREALCAFFRRRAPGGSELSTSRREPDEPIFTEGLDADGRTTGAPLKAVIRNTDVRSSDYDDFRTVPRPGHADYPAYVKTGQIPSGGGKWSGRMTAPLCIAGGLALQLLAAGGIRIEARIRSIGGVEDPERFEETILAAKAAGDSVGGIVECLITGLPVGLGDHPFDGLENRIAAAVFGIPAVKGIEFGDGFALSALRGSQANDPYRYADGRVVTATNHCGGILGGMSDGMPVLFRAAFKPTPTIALEQNSVDLALRENVTVRGKGRHDPCIVPRAVPVVEAAAAAAVYDALLAEKKAKKEPSPRPQELSAFRDTIDSLDAQLLAAFCGRMETVSGIAAYKQKNGLPVFDPEREKALLQKIAGHSPEELKDYSLKLYETVLALSRQYQQQLLSEKEEP